MLSQPLYHHSKLQLPHSTNSLYQEGLLSLHRKIKSSNQGKIPSEVHESLKSIVLVHFQHNRPKNENKKQRMVEVIL